MHDEPANSVHPSTPIANNTGHGHHPRFDRRSAIAFSNPQARRTDGKRAEVTLSLPGWTNVTRSRRKHAWSECGPER
jgi:hypothetical protein